MTELADVFAELDDPRAVNARRRSLHDIRFIALARIHRKDAVRVVRAVTCGEESPRPSCYPDVVHLWGGQRPE